MRARPRSIVALTAFFLCLGLYLLITAISHLKTDSSLLSEFLIGGGLLVMSYAIWSVRRWGYFVSLTMSSVGVVYSLWSYFQSADLSGYSFLISTVCLSAITSYFLQRHVSSPYFNPRERWWETPPRYRAHFQVHLSVQGQDSEVELVDISRSGCFVKTPVDFKSGQLVYMRIAFLDIRLDLMTKVVRQAKAPDRGAGLMFVDLARSDAKDLALLLEHLQTHRISATKRDEISPAA